MGGSIPRTRSTPTTGTRYSPPTSNNGHGKPSSRANAYAVVRPIRKTCAAVIKSTTAGNAATSATVITSATDSPGFTRRPRYQRVGGVPSPGRPGKVDADERTPLLQRSNARGPAAAERIEHDIATRTTQTDTTPGDLQRPRRRMPSAGTTRRHLPQIRPILSRRATGPELVRSRLRQQEHHLVALGKPIAHTLRPRIRLLPHHRAPQEPTALLQGNTTRQGTPTRSLLR